MSKEIVYNKSKTYLLPLLSEFIPLKIDYVKFLENTYLFDDKGKYKDCIFVLHDFSFRNPEFTQYEHGLTSSEFFVDLVDIDNQVLYIFKFPDVYLDEYNHFINGKYSKFGEDAKELVLSFWGEVYTEKVSAVAFLLKLKQVLFKDKLLKQQLERELSTRTSPVVLDDEAELASIIDESDETFELSKYITDED
jgi:hypothetical protein